LKWPAADLAIRDELLRRNGSIDPKLEILSAERATYVLGTFHEVKQVVEVAILRSQLELTILRPTIKHRIVKRLLFQSTVYIQEGARI